MKVNNIKYTDYENYYICKSSLNSSFVGVVKVDENNIK